MLHGRDNGQAPPVDAGQATPRRTAVDVALVVLVALAVVAVAAGAPTNLYAYAQLRRVGTALSMLETGDWILPVNQTTEIASKPQLYPWLTAAAVWLTGRYDELLFRLPTILATLLTAVMVYFLARRWYGRSVGLLAGCLWATCVHMNRMAYLAATDMLLAGSVAGSVLCVDRLLYHRAPRRARWPWAVGLWATILLGALSKGWGVVNLALVGLTVVLASGLGGGFAACRAAGGLPARLAVGVRLFWRRVRRAMRAVRLGWGLLAAACVLGPLWAAMFLRGGKEFADLVYFELIQRLTGAGEHAPKAASAPAVLSWLYYALPASVPAVGAVVLAARQTGWAGLFSRRNPLLVPLCWTAAVLVPFSLSHGFRPDYLLPAYAPTAILAGWCVERLRRGGAGADPPARLVRHAVAGTCLAMCLALPATVAWLWLRPPEEFLQQTAAGPVFLPGGGYVTLWLPVVGLAGAALVVRFSLQWRIRPVVACGVVASLGVMFLYTHTLSRHARTRDGETMREFAETAGALLGKGPAGEPFAVYRTNKLSVEPYLGRLGIRLEVVDPNGPLPPGTAETIGTLADGRRLILRPLPGRPARRGCRWLITCDYGLCALGACRPDPNGPYRLRVVSDSTGGRGRRAVQVQPLPEVLGRPRLASRPLQTQNRGRIYLIELRRPVRVAGRALVPAWESGKRDEDDEED